MPGNLRRHVHMAWKPSTTAASAARRSRHVTAGRVSAAFACSGKSSALSLLEACVTPCMENLNNRCCMVPAPIAYLFPCCRELHCCPDQKASGHRRARRALGRRAPSAAPGRAMPAVSVAVGVEENNSAKVAYDGIVSCLRSHTAATCKSTPKLMLLKPQPINLG